MTGLPIVFDLDGTLIDSAPDIHACVNATLRQHRLPLLSLGQVRGFIGGGVDVLWAHIARAIGIAPEMQRDLLASFMVRYHHATGLTRMFPHVAETLGILADRGHRLAICTNKPMAPAVKILEHFGLNRLFSYVIAGDTLPLKKPDPAPLRAAFEGLDSPDLRGYFVGDSEFDELTAAALPAPFLLFTEGYRKTPVARLRCLHSFSDFLELPALCAAPAPA